MPAAAALAQKWPSLRPGKLEATADVSHSGTSRRLRWREAGQKDREELQRWASRMVAQTALAAAILIVSASSAAAALAAVATDHELRTALTDNRDRDQSSSTSVRYRCRMAVD